MKTLKNFEYNDVRTRVLTWQRLFVKYFWQLITL